MAPPRTSPSRRTASSAYAEQLGVCGHRGPWNDPTDARYRRQGVYATCPASGRQACSGRFASEVTGCVIVGKGPKPTTAAVSRATVFDTVAPRRNRRHSACQSVLDSLHDSCLVAIEEGFPRC